MPNYEFTPRQQEEIEPSVENDHEKKNSLTPLRSPEEIAADKRKNMLGSSVLALVNFQEKKSSKEDKQAVVTPYYEKLSYRIKKEEALAKQEAKITGEPIRKIEKIPGENPKEKKIYAYIERLNNTIVKYGSRVEKKIWDESVRRAELIVKKENISAKSWRLLEEEFHESNKNANRPPAVFDEESKQKKYEEIVSLQKQSLDKWFNYLSTPDTPEDAEEGEPDRPRYPIWFKVYVFDAISKMSSVFKEDEGKYATRAKDTISYFPDLDAGALALTFDALNDFFGKDEEALSSKYDNDEKLLSLVKSGNFNHIYSKFKQDSIEDIKTPEKAEQVRGVWDTYGPGDEEEISKVSQGTPWCIRSPEAAKKYLKTNQQIENNQAKFILFRQEKDHSTGETYKTASASIRLDTMGRVAEVSGMLDGQGIEDSLVLIVEQEARKYPFDPDKHFEEKFRDKKKLIELWKKSEKNENLTKEEIEFLYEKDKSIWSLDTYTNEDPKITQLRDFYDLKRILSQGTELSQEHLKLIAEKSTAESILNNFEELKNGGVPLKTLARHMWGEGIMDHFDEFIDGKVPLKTLLNRMDPSTISKHLEKLKSSGASLETLARNMWGEGIMDHFDEFIDGKVPLKTLLNRMDPSTISKHLEKLKSSGASLETLARHMLDEDIIEHFDEFIKGGVLINMLLSRMSLSTIFKHFEKLKSSVSHKVLLVHTSDRIKTSLKNMNPVLFIKNLLQKR